RHDACLHWLSDRTALDDAGRNFFDWVGDVGFDRTPPVHRIAQRVNNASQQTLANRHLQQFSSGPDFVPLFELGVVSEDHDADFGFIEVQRQPGDSLAKVDHLVEHRIIEAFNSGHAVTDLTNDPDVLFYCSQPGFVDLSFDLL